MGAKFEILYADCPWRYKDKAAAGQRGAEFKYPTMSDQEILDLPVKEIAADNAILFLWITYPRLNMLFPVMEAWGFKYKTLGFLWEKLNPESGTSFFGMGNWTRANSEPCFIGVRGKPKRVNASVRQIVRSPIRAHSQKPDEVRERIVQLMGDVPRIELFARTAAPGWTAVGNGIDGRDIRTVLAEMAEEDTEVRRDQTGCNCYPGDPCYAHGNG